MDPIKEYDLFDGVHKGETCIVIGNGPTLRDVPAGFLDKYPTFGTNRIYLLDGFEPCYYVAVNSLVLTQFGDDIARLMSGSVKFVAERFAKDIPDAVPVRRSPVESFSFDPRTGMYEGWTVTYVCLQLAYFMGFTRVYLVGLDHRYKVPAGTSGGIQLIGTGPDVNHFSNGYFAAATLWHSPDLAKSARAYDIARKVYQADRREIINLTPGSALDVFDKMALEDVYHG